MDILDDMGVSKLSAKVFLKVNYSFNPYPHHFLSIYTHQWKWWKCPKRKKNDL